MAIVAKRTIMTLYSDNLCPYSHQVRIVLAEKGVNFEMNIVNADMPFPESLLELNPYATVPILLDRELVLYHPAITLEYLDERFPHPPLLPVYPVARAEQRKMMARIETDWYSLMKQIRENSNDATKARSELRDSLVGLDPVFADKPYFLSDEFSLLDCVLAPMLWRLPLLGITLPPTLKGIRNYMDRVFARPSFQASLTEVERELHVA